MGIKLQGIGQSLPKKVITNIDLESITPGSKADWVKEKLGIDQRRVIRDVDELVEIGRNAVLKALGDSGMGINDLNYLLVNTSSSPFESPSLGARVLAELGLEGIPVLDINAVCSGFVYGLELISMLVSKYSNVGLLSIEAYSRITDWSDRNSCFFGDGAVATIWSKEDSDNFISLVGSEASGWENFHCYAGQTFKMNGKEVYKFGSRVLPEKISELMSSNKLDINKIDWVLPHQPSHNILKATAAALGVSEEKIIFNMGPYANTAGASIPMALYEGLKSNKIKRNSNLLFAAVGSGWTYGVAHFKLT